jgi:hypothetical protein
MKAQCCRKITLPRYLYFYLHYESPTQDTCTDVCRAWNKFSKKCAPCAHLSLQKCAPAQKGVHHFWTLIFARGHLKISMFFFYMKLILHPPPPIWLAHHTYTQAADRITECCHEKNALNYVMVGCYQEEEEDVITSSIIAHVKLLFSKNLSVKPLLNTFRHFNHKLSIFLWGKSNFIMLYRGKLVRN